MNSPCVVRRADASDATRLRAIRLEALSDTPEAYGSTYEESLQWPARRWRKVAKSWNYYLGECDGIVRGMASGGYNDEHPGTCWLYGMYVSPGQRGSGLAIQLVDAVEAFVVDSAERERSTASVGELIMARLKQIDTVAYIRFASVYRDFKDVNEFKEELEGLLSNRDSRPRRANAR